MGEVAMMADACAGRPAFPEGFRVHTLQDGHQVAVGQLPPELMPSDERFEALWNLHPEERAEILIHGQRVRIPRWQEAYERDYRFSRRTARATPAPDILRPYLQWTQQIIDRRLNGVLLNWYDARLGHYIGPHSDAYGDLVPNSPIVTISLGEAREFRLTQSQTRDGNRRQLYRLGLHAAHGSVIILPWRTNLAWKHSVPRKRSYNARRISITVRAFLPAEGKES